MKAEFLRHEYTWSKKTISGTMGLGVISSSTPKERDQLRELEKMASMAEADSKKGMEAELLMYHDLTGFVKMAVIPAPAGADQRKNKKVFMYQCVDKKSMDPAIYCLPKGSWEPTGSSYLPGIVFDESWDVPKTIFVKYQLADRLPDLFRAVFWCVFRGTNSLTVYAPWKRENFAQNSRELMYAIHSLLPEGLRKNAGYASMDCGMNRYSSFCFTDTKPDQNYYDLKEKVYYGEGSLEDELDHFFYQSLAVLYWKNEALFQNFMSQVAFEVAYRDIDKKLLREIQWTFLQFSIQNMMDIPEIGKVMGLFPQLFYNASDSEKLSEIQCNLLEYYHLGSWDRKDYERYLEVLRAGLTRKGEEKILDEMTWTLEQYGSRYKSMSEDYLNNLKDSGKSLYTRLLTRKYLEEASPAYRYFLKNSGSIASMKEYIEGMDVNVIPEDFKNLWMYRAIQLLNENIFDISSYEVITEVAKLLKKEEKWTQVLDSFLSEIKERNEELDEGQREILKKIQEIYQKLTDSMPSEEAPSVEKNTETPIPEQADVKPEQAERKDKTEEQAEQKTPEEVVEMAPERKYRKRRKQISDSLVEEIKDEDEANQRGAFIPFLLRSLPYGFLTGCVLFLINYGLVICHWKISLGAAGMWLIMILNYAMDRVEKKKSDGYRMWMAIGLCLFEGYLIQTVAWLFLPKIYRIYFFLGLGFLMVILQFVQILLYKKREPNEVNL